MLIIAVVVGVVFFFIIVNTCSGNEKTKKRANGYTGKQKARERAKRTQKGKKMVCEVQYVPAVKTNSAKNKNTRNGAKRRRKMYSEEMMPLAIGGAMMQQAYEDDDMMWVTDNMNREMMERMSNPLLTPGVDMIVDEQVHGIDNGFGIVNPEHNFEDLSDSCSGGWDDSFFNSGFGCDDF